MNYYQDIAPYYDLLMDAQYYDHRSLAQDVRSAIGERKRLLELGIGTGRLVQELLNIDSTYDITGIDFSPAMVDKAAKSLPSSVTLIECDVAQMSLNHKFDVAISSGGTWVISKSDPELLLGTHLYNHEKDLCGLQNVADHLHHGGLLLLSVHQFHQDWDIDLVDGIVYSQRILARNGTTDHFYIEKNYSFEKNGTTLAQETLTLGFYRSTVFLRMLVDVGFEPLGMTHTKTFFVFKKVM